MAREHRPNAKQLLAVCVCTFKRNKLSSLGTNYLLPTYLLVGLHHTLVRLVQFGILLSGAAETGAHFGHLRLHSIVGQHRSLRGLVLRMILGVQVVQLGHQGAHSLVQFVALRFELTHSVGQLGDLFLVLLGVGHLGAQTVAFVEDANQIRLHRLDLSASQPETLLQAFVLYDILGILSK